MHISKSNILWILHGSEKKTSNVLKILKYLYDFVPSRRMEFVAKAGFDAVFYARQKCEKNLTPGCLNNEGEVPRISVIGFR